MFHRSAQGLRHGRQLEVVDFDRPPLLQAIVSTAIESIAIESVALVSIALGSCRQKEEKKEREKGRANAEYGYIQSVPALACQAESTDPG